MLFALPITCMMGILSYCVPKNKIYLDPFGCVVLCLHLTWRGRESMHDKLLYSSTPTSTAIDLLSKKWNRWNSNPNFKWKRDLKYSIPDWQPIDCILAIWPIPKHQDVEPPKLLFHQSKLDLPKNYLSWFCTKNMDRGWLRWMFPNSSAQRGCCGYATDIRPTNGCPSR